MIKRPLLLKIYEAASMQRWNDQIRTIEITELDKQAHKMIVAYILGKLELQRGNKEIDWLEIIEAGFFEYLQRIILTDLKPPLFYEIKRDRKKYLELNQWVYEKVSPFIKELGQDFCTRFKNYIMDENGSENINRKIISAAHFYITKWEFEIIRRFNPEGYQISEIKTSIDEEQEKYKGVGGVKDLLRSRKLFDLHRHLRPAQVSGKMEPSLQGTQDFRSRSYADSCDLFLSVFTDSWI